MSKIYLAYGSNMSTEQMAHRCPNAKMIDIVQLPGYRLVFTGEENRSYASIVPDENATIPVMLWHLTPEDEQSLDKYEGYPDFYEKAELQVNNQLVMYYYMQPKYSYGIPSDAYYQIIATAYQKYGLDTKILQDALLESQKALKMV